MDDVCVDGKKGQERIKNIIVVSCGPSATGGLRYDNVDVAGRGIRVKMYRKNSRVLVRLDQLTRGISEADLLEARIVSGRSVDEDVDTGPRKRLVVFFVGDEADDGRWDNGDVFVVAVVAAGAIRVTPATQR